MQPCFKLVSKHKRLKLFVYDNTFFMSARKVTQRDNLLPAAKHSQWSFNVGSVKHNLRCLWLFMCALCPGSRWEGSSLASSHASSRANRECEMGFKPSWDGLVYPADNGFLQKHSDSEWEILWVSPLFRCCIFVIFQAAWCRYTAIAVCHHMNFRESP